MVRRPRQRAGMCPGRGRRREEVDGGRSCRPPSAARGLRATARPGEDDPIAHREDPVPHPRRTSGCGPGSRTWRRRLPGTVRAGPCCPRLCSAARASSRRSPARGASAASSAALPATAVPRGPGSRSAPTSATRPRTRACAPVAPSPMSPTASTSRPSSRSRSRPTNAGSSAPAGAGVANARPRPWK